MKRITSLAAVFALLAAALTGCGAVEADAGVRLLAASVGKGDALLVQAGGYTCLIDTGKAHARGKVLSAMEWLGVTALDAVFITHCDNDHVGGLDWLAQSDIPVGAWYAAGYFVEVQADKHPALLAAAARGQQVTWLTRGDAVALGDSGAVFRVLAPSMALPDKDDNNSLVMMLESGDGRVLFTGDMELPQEGLLLSEEDDLACDVLKAPNHGDDDTLSEAFARAASAQIAVISTDEMEKPGTPDPGVLRRLRAAGATCYVTQDATLGIDVRLTGGRAQAQLVDIPDGAVSGVYIASVDAQDDRVTLANYGEKDVDLTGFYLYSDRGDEIYAFPDGCALSAGGSLTVGTRSTKGDADLLWDDKKVIHKSRTDNILLYDRWGRCVDGQSNGQ